MKAHRDDHDPVCMHIKHSAKMLLSCIHAAATKRKTVCDHEIQLFNLKVVQDVRLGKTNQTGPLISQLVLKIQQLQRFANSRFSQMQESGALKKSQWGKMCAGGGE